MSVENYLSEVKARAEAATIGPWSHCKECKCDLVMFNDGPIANVTKGEWGDDYPSLRFVKGSEGTSGNQSL